MATTNPLYWPVPTAPSFDLIRLLQAQFVQIKSSNRSFGYMWLQVRIVKMRAPDQGFCFCLFQDTHIRSSRLVDSYSGLYEAVLHKLDGGFAAFAWYICIGHGPHGWVCRG